MLAVKSFIVSVKCFVTSCLWYSLSPDCLSRVSSRVLPSTCPPCFCGYEICDTAAAASDTKADMWWEMDRKWERLEALMELRRRYFHTSSSHALSTSPPDSSDWTGSITVSGWNRLQCCFYYIRLLHFPPPSSLLPPPRCPAPSLRPLLVIYLLWAFFIWARVAHHCSRRVCLREWKLLFTRRGFMDFWHGACASKQQVEDKNCFVPPRPPWISSKWTVSCSGICSRISRTFSPLLLFFYMIIRSSWGRLVELPAAVFISLRLKFRNFVMLISMSANCLIKNVRTNETGAHKDQDVIKYSEACWSFIGHVMYLTELDGVV